MNLRVCECQHLYANARKSSDHPRSLFAPSASVNAELRLQRRHQYSSFNEINGSCSRMGCNPILDCLYLFPLFSTRKSSTPSVSRGGVPPSWTWPGYPPPTCGQTDGWMDGQTHVKTLPSRRTTYAVVNETDISCVVTALTLGVNWPQQSYCKRQVLLFIENIVNSLGVNVLVEGEIFEALNEAFYHTRQRPEIHVRKILKWHTNLPLKP